MSKLDWSSPDWGGHVTESQSGSWLDAEPRHAATGGQVTGDD